MSSLNVKGGVICDNINIVDSSSYSGQYQVSISPPTGVVYKCGPTILKIIFRLRLQNFQLRDPTFCSVRVEYRGLTFQYIFKKKNDY